MPSPAASARRHRFPFLLPFALVAALALAGCASLPAGPTVGTAAAASPAANPTAKANTTAPATPTGAPGAGAAPAQPGQPRPFADVVKDAKESPGLFRMWQKDDKVWLEIAPEQFGAAYFFTSNLNRGIGEKRLYGGMMTYPVGVSEIVEFRKVGQIVQLVARNVKYTAKPGTPEAHAVAAGFSDSLLASTPIASQPHPERKSVLVEANALLVGDLPGAALVLERQYRQPYAFDARNSALDRARAVDGMMTFEVTAHYALARPVTPPPAAPGSPPPAVVPTLPETVPDPRSLFLGFFYTLARLPETPMTPRIADERIGYFTADRVDFTSDLARVPVVRYVTRWRLEKQDPAAALSEPKAPIVFWLDRNIPQKYRAPIRSGILEWNKAFEKIGYKDAIHVEQQPDNADFDTADLRHASVRWQTVAKTSYGAIGPSVVDPRTGEILDADIGIDATNVRNVRSLRSEYIPHGFAATDGAGAGTGPGALQCDSAERGAAEAVFGMALLQARGELDPEGPEVEEFVAAYLHDVTMHEVGHTLGLRHNFRASTIYTEAELADPAFTRVNGISGSVMEYNPWNIARRGQPQGEYQQSTLGPYDYWAVEYGYREFPAAEEKAALAAIAARSSEPRLAFATDEEAGPGALDPAVNTHDLGSDPLAYAEKRLALVRELWQSTERRELKAGESYSVLRRNFSRGLAEATEGALYAARYIGGITVLRDKAGSGRDPLTPVPVDKQRAALRLIATEVFSADSFRFPPSFLRRLSVSDFDRGDAAELGRAMPQTDVAVDQQVLAMQRGVLGLLLSDMVAQRMLNNETKVDAQGGALRLPELYATLHDAVWSELRERRDIALPRRNLQREYGSRLAAALLRPLASMPADARALLRADATRLRDELAAEAGRATRSAEARAHLAEMRIVIDEALKAPIVRQGA